MGPPVYREQFFRLGAVRIVIPVGEDGCIDVFDPLQECRFIDAPADSTARAREPDGKEAAAYVVDGFAGAGRRHEVHLCVRGGKAVLWPGGQHGSAGLGPAWLRPAWWGGRSPGAKSEGTGNPGSSLIMSVGARRDAGVPRKGRWVLDGAPSRGLPVSVGFRQGAARIPEVRGYGARPAQHGAGHESEQHRPGAREQMRGARVGHGADCVRQRRQSFRGAQLLVGNVESIGELTRGGQGRAG